MKYRRTIDQAKADSINRFHIDGAAKFGADWLAANQSAVAVLRAACLEPHNNKWLGVLIASRLCQWIALGRSTPKGEKP